MDLTVAIGAAAIEKERRVLSARRNRMLRHAMTLSAQPRVGHFEQPIVYRSVRLVTVGAVFHHRRVLMQKRTAAFGMAGIAIFVDAGLLELGRIGRAVRIVAACASQLSLPHGHVGRTHQLSFPLQMTLTAHLGLRSFIEEGGSIVDFGELVAVGGFLHQSVAVDASDAAAGMRAGGPIGLNAALMTAKTRLVLQFGGLFGIFAKRDHAADAFAAATGDMIASRTVTIFASLLFSFVARVVEKNFAHLGLGKFFKLGSVASLANFVADVGSRGGFGRVACGGPDP